MRYPVDDCRRQWWIQAHGAGCAEALLEQIDALWMPARWSEARLSGHAPISCAAVKTAANPRVSTVTPMHWPETRGPSDTDYRAHLIAEITRPRGTPKAIEANVRRRLGFEITVIETWKWMTRWSVSPLSAGHASARLCGLGAELMRLDYPGGVTTEDRLAIRAVAEEDRAAGCLIIDDCGCSPLTWMDGGWDTRTWDYCT
ncbi:MAG: hypothetical protein MZV65_31560 [Chromatiales bacterium]|nr:hypothetical protein [Chromatiales bacterium]